MRISCRRSGVRPHQPSFPCCSPNRRARMVPGFSAACRLHARVRRSGRTPSLAALHRLPPHAWPRGAPGGGGAIRGGGASGCRRLSGAAARRAQRSAWRAISTCDHPIPSACACTANAAHQLQAASCAPAQSLRSVVDTGAGSPSGTHRAALGGCMRLLGCSLGIEVLAGHRSRAGPWRR